MLRKNKLIQALLISLFIITHSLFIITHSFADEVLTNETIVSLTKAGLGKDVIKAKIKADRNQFDVSTNGILKLKESGVEDEVIKEMIESLTPESQKLVPAQSPPEEKKISVENMPEDMAKDICKEQALGTIKKEFKFKSCKEYAYEKGMERPAYRGSLFGLRGGGQPVPNKRDYKIAIQECNVLYKKVFDDCMTGNVAKNK